jgi:DNA-binding winged helix-turn-helix (wHTH) protein
MLLSFGEVELDDQRLTLRRAGKPVVVQPKVLELLLFLIRNPDRVIRKQELLDALWPDSAVGDSSLARAISVARRAIGDSARSPRVILTIPRLGYRLCAAVRAALAEGESRTLENGYVGRGDLLESATASLDSALAGRGRVLLLTGEAGIGKTRTAEELAERARERGAEVAAAWSHEPGAQAYRAWSRALRGLAERIPHRARSLSPAQRMHIARVVPELASGQAAPRTSSGEAERARLFEAVQAFIAQVARSRPVALFLDDLHAFDVESIWLLEFVAQSLATLPVAIVATCREDDAAREPLRARAFERLLRSTSLTRWELEGLRDAELRNFVQMRLHAEVDDELLAVLACHTGGNPLLLSESLRSLDARELVGAARSRQEWEALLPRGIEHLLRPKLRSLSAPGLEVLACAAAAGLEVDRGLLAGCFAGRSDVDTCLAELAAAGLIRMSVNGAKLRFSHVLVHQAIYEELLPRGESRRLQHARIAEVLAASAARLAPTLAERARHACEAAPLVPAEEAVELAQRSGEEALRSNDFEGALAWFERALEAERLRECADLRLRAKLQLGLATAQVRTRGLERARPTFRAAAAAARASGAPDTFAEAVLGFADRPSSMGTGDPDVIAVLEDAVRQAGRVGEALAIRVASRLAAELRYADRTRAERLEEEAIARARSLGDPLALAQTLDDCTFIRWRPADARAWIALNQGVVRAARAAGDLELALSGQKGCVTGFLELGEHTRANRELRALESTAQALRTPYARWLVALFDGMRALLAGELTSAEEAIVRSLRLAERIDTAETSIEMSAQLVYLRFEQGRSAEIEPIARAQVARLPEQPAWRAAHGRILAALGRAAEARDSIAPLVRSGFRDVPLDRGWFTTHALAADIAYATRDERAAVLLEGALAPHVGRTVMLGNSVYYGPVALHLGRLAAARGAWDESVAQLEHGLAEAQGAGARVFEARAALALARALELRGRPADRERAAQLRSESTSAATQLGLVEVLAEADRTSYPAFGS